MASKQACWLVKSEPDCFSIQDLARSPRRTTCWSGVRNYQARNFMRAMKRGDQVLFYHSSADPPAVAGTAIVVREAYPDSTALDPRDDHYDPKASREHPIWEMVDLRLEKIFPRPIPIGELRAVSALAEMELLRKGSRLSVQPVRPREFETVLTLAAAPGVSKSDDPLAARPRKKSATTAKAKPKQRVVRAKK